MVFIAFMFLIYRLRVILSRIILPILEADENIPVLFHDFAQKLKADFIPFFLSNPSSFKSYSCPLVTGNDVLFHGFNVSHPPFLSRYFFNLFSFLFSSIQLPCQALFSGIQKACQVVSRWFPATCGPEGPLSRWYSATYGFLLESEAGHGQVFCANGHPLNWL